MADNIIPFPRKPANDNNASSPPPCDAAARLPSSPEVALTLGLVYQRLEGWFSITSRGQRGYGRPCYFRDRALPQLPFAPIHQQFHSQAEYEGAMKMLEVLISRLDKSDADFVFDAFGHAAVGEAA